MEADPPLAMFIRACELQERCGGFRLRDLLAMPLQVRDYAFDRSIYVCITFPNGRGERDKRRVATCFDSSTTKRNTCRKLVATRNTIPVILFDAVCCRESRRPET